jgi:surface protein
MAIGAFRLPITAAATPDPSGWVRPSDWLAMPTNITDTDQTFVGLHAIFPEGQNYCAFLFTTSAGQYQVDWGDGSTPTLHNSNTLAQYEYNYATYDVGNTTLSSRGYKQAIITVTAVSGLLTTCNFQFRFTTTPAQNQAYSTGFLDCILSMPNASSGASIVFGGTTVRHARVERFNVLTIGGCTSMNNMFRLCNSLQSVPLFDTSNVSNMFSMFFECYSLKLVPLFNTFSVTNMGNMFEACGSLQSIPLFNTSSVTNMSRMFAMCYSLMSIPLLNTSSVSNMDAMLFTCLSLKSIPALSTASITTTSGQNFGSFYTGTSIVRCEMIFARQIALFNGQLSRTALVEIFTNLVDRSSTTSATITITGNWGASALTTAERDIALNKNWTITG